MTARFGDERDWFFEKRYGMFVHWGLYAIAAWHEQVQAIKAIPRAQYERYASQFNPTHFDADAWLDLAQEVGMGYLCITTKHHDGFCLFDTAETDYNVMNTPYQPVEHLGRWTVGAIDWIANGFGRHVAGMGCSGHQRRMSGFRATP